MATHGDYWQGQADAGIAIAVGPVLAAEGAFGMALVESVDEEAAQSLGDADPIIAAGLGFRYSLSPVPSLILRA